MGKDKTIQLTKVKDNFISSNKKPFAIMQRVVIIRIKF
jgi:hypothetical protein